MNNNQKKSLIGKRGKDKSKQFPAKEMQMNLKPRKRCSTSPIEREMQIKMTVRLFFSPKRLANYKKFNNTLLEKLEEDSNIHTNNGNYH